MSRTWNRNGGGVVWFAALGAIALASLVGCGTSEQATGDFGGNPHAAPSDPTPTPASDAAEQLARDIEEADIVKVVGDRIYVLNPYKGLIVVGVADPDSPRVLGSLDLRGRGVEMYVVGQRAYVVLSADFGIAFDALPGASGNGASLPSRPVPPPEFTGSQLAIIDVSVASTPTKLGAINLVGYANASRRVGDVIYVIGDTNAGYTHYYADPGDEPVNEGFVASVNVANPSNITPVDRKTFSGHGLLLHASSSALFAASQDWNDTLSQIMTHIQYVDISDIGGAIALRDTVDVPGWIRNRFYMDDYNDVLRVATESNGFGFSKVRLYTYDLADPDNITALGQVDIIQGESLQAVRFDGPRGYAVTFLQVDPLFVLDLNDPTNPSVSGHLEVPGFSTHIEPRGERLIAVGVDNTNGNRPALSYYDVADTSHPSELSRVVLGPPGSYTDSQATYDEKAFKIIDELNLIAIPFRHQDMTWGGPVPAASGAEDNGEFAPTPAPRCQNAVQLVDFGDSGLTKRGAFEHRGYVQRVGVIGNRVFAISNAALQTVNIDDRDQPTKAGEAAFFDDAGMTLYLSDCGYWYGGFPQNDNCGGIAIIPLAALMLGLGIIRCTAGRRRR